MKKSLQLLLLAVLIGSFVTSSFAYHNPSAITWSPKEFTCPVDNEKNTFMVVASYGSYIYSDPSKYQWLFFPNTAHNNFYMCKKCHLATYMWDFDKVPKDKVQELRKLLASVKVSKNFKKYTQVPVTERLEVMQKVYGVLKKKDGWWERFYRIKGYHYGAAGEAVKASEARKKSLELIGGELKNKKSTVSRKLLLYTSASMKHFLADDIGAIEDLQTALKTKYAEAGLNAEKLKNAEDGLNERIKDYIDRINSDKKPRMVEKPDSDGR